MEAVSKEVRHAIRRESEGVRRDGFQTRPCNGVPSRVCRGAKPLKDGPRFEISNIKRGSGEAPAGSLRVSLRSSSPPKIEDPPQEEWGTKGVEPYHGIPQRVAD